jgi:site-specific recombinase XerD
MIQSTEVSNKKRLDKSKGSVAYYRGQLDVLKQNELKQFQYYLQSQRYSASTRRGYLGFISSFLGYFDSKDTQDISLKEVHQYNSQVIIKSGYSVSYQRQFIGALKLFFGYVVNAKFDMEELERP